MDSKLISGLKKTATFYKTAAILGLNIFICFVIAELLADVYLDATKEPFEEKRVHLSYYLEQDWSQRYWQEFGSIKQSYQPFTIWFMFGGSTMWGTGAPDAGTIPSYLLQEIEPQVGGTVCMVNFGESAYTSTQNLITLIAELQQGNVPDFVIFYDGVNDTSAVFTSAEQWTHANLSRITKRFEPIDPLWHQLLKSRRLYLMAQKIRMQNREAPILTFAQDASTVAGYVSTAYTENYQIVDALSQKYQFDYAFFWQPVIRYSQKELTSEEEAMVDTAKLVQISFDDEIYDRIEFLHLVYDHVIPKLEQLEFAYDISNVFEDEQTLAYIDFVHVTPAANQLVAAKMFEQIQSSLLKQDSQP